MIWKAELGIETPTSLFRDIRISQHEREVTRYFGKGVYVRPGDPVVEAPVCFLLFTNRSGSNYLGSLLNTTGKFCNFGETSNHETVLNHAAARGLSSLASYYYEIHRTYAHPNMLFGQKLSVQQLLFLLRTGIVPRVFPNTRWIWIQRLDVVAQAISLYIAQKTLQWTSLHPGTDAEVTYDFAEISQRIRGLTLNNSHIARVTASLGLNPAFVAYEQLVERPKAVVESIFRHFRMQPAAPALADVAISRQADERNREFRERYIADAKRGLERPRSRFFLSRLPVAAPRQP